MRLLLPLIGYWLAVGMACELGAVTDTRKIPGQAQAETKAAQTFVFQMQPLAVPDSGQSDQRTDGELIQALDSNEYSVRQAAFRETLRRGEKMLPLLEQELQSKRLSKLSEAGELVRLLGNQAIQVPVQEYLIALKTFMSAAVAKDPEVERIHKQLRDLIQRNASFREALTEYRAACEASVGLNIAVASLQMGRVNAEKKFNTAKTDGERGIYERAIASLDESLKQKSEQAAKALQNLEQIHQSIAAVLENQLSAVQIRWTPVAHAGIIFIPETTHEALEHRLGEGLPEKFPRVEGLPPVAVEFLPAESGGDWTNATAVFQPQIHLHANTLATSVHYTVTLTEGSGKALGDGEVFTIKRLLEDSTLSR